MSRSYCNLPMSFFCAAPLAFKIRIHVLRKWYSRSGGIAATHIRIKTTTSANATVPMYENRVRIVLGHEPYSFNITEYTVSWWLHTINHEKTQELDNRKGPQPEGHKEQSSLSVVWTPLLKLPLVVLKQTACHIFILEQRRSVQTSLPLKACRQSPQVANGPLEQVAFVEKPLGSIQRSTSLTYDPDGVTLIAVMAVLQPKKAPSNTVSERHNDAKHGEQHHKWD